MTNHPNRSHQYRLIVGEQGNEQGHVVRTSAKSLRGANIALARALQVYDGDGWGYIEQRHPTAPHAWIKA